MKDKKLEKAIIYLHDVHEKWLELHRAFGNANHYTHEAMEAVIACEKLIATVWGIQEHEVRSLMFNWESEHSTPA